MGEVRLVHQSWFTYLSNSYVSPRRGLKGFPTLSQFEVAMDMAKAVTY